MVRIPATPHAGAGVLRYRSSLSSGFFTYRGPTEPHISTTACACRFNECANPLEASTYICRCVVKLEKRFSLPTHRFVPPPHSRFPLAAVVPRPPSRDHPHGCWSCAALQCFPTRHPRVDPAPPGTADEYAVRSGVASAGALANWLFPLGRLGFGQARGSMTTGVEAGTCGVKIAAWEVEYF